MSRTSSRVEIPTRAVIRTLLLTDLVDSTKLVGQLGDQRAAEIGATHDRIARDLLDPYGGYEIDKTDGFLLLFERPIDALRYALAYHNALAKLSVELDVPLTARAGIHLGEVILRENPPEDVSRGAKPVEVEGYTKPTAARLMSLAIGQQTLISRVAFDLARRALRGADDFPENAKWLAHGPYVFKGVDESLEVCEVGIEEISPLKPPPGSEKARRAVAPGDEITLGWRPAKGQEIPNRKNWLLEDKLGEGGFGEVWLAARGAEKRVFKFCFHSDRLRALKREVVLFRLLQETLGAREDIASIIDWQFEEPPYFIESQYTRGGNLIDWASERGGMRNVSEGVRLELVAQVADALAAAHSVGVLHKDIKPSNILVYTDSEQRPRARLTDFGIGLITDRSLLAARGITATGLTETSISSAGGTSSNSGTRIYMAPELLEGRPATVQSDLYALGVMLYQMMVGDLRRALAPGWERNIQGDVLREDIAACIDGDPQKRLHSTSELAERLRTVRDRQVARENEARDKEESRRAQQFMERSRKRRKFLITAFSGVFVIGLLLVALAIYSVQQAKIADVEREKAIEARLESEKKGDQLADALKVVTTEGARAERELYFSRILLASSYLSQRRYDFAEQALWSASEDLRDVEWGFLLWQTNLDLQAMKGHTQPVMGIEIGGGSEGSGAMRVLTVSRDRTAKVWDPRTGNELMTLKPEGDRPELPAEVLEDPFVQFGNAYIAKFSPDGKLVATSFPEADPADSVVRLWDLSDPTAAFYHTLQGHTGLITHLEFSSDGERILTASKDGTARLWQVGRNRNDPRRGREVGSITHSSDTSVRVTYATLSHDGLKIATCGSDGTVRIWNSRASMGAPDVTLEAHNALVYRAAFSKGDDLLFTAGMRGSGGVTLSPFGEGKLWNVATGKLIHAFEEELEIFSEPVFNTLSDDLLMAARDGAMRDPVAVLYQTSRRPSDVKRKMILRGHDGSVLDAEFSPAEQDGQQFVATASADRTVRLWDPKNGAEQIVLSGHSGAVPSVAFSPRGFFVASASTDATAKLWDTLTRPEMMSMAGSNREIVAAALDPDGTKMAMGYASGELEIHDLTSEGNYVALRKYDEPVAAINWFEEGRLLTAGYDGRADQWQIRLTEPAGNVLNTIIVDRQIEELAVSYQEGSALSIIVGGPGGYAQILDMTDTSNSTLLTGIASDIKSVALAPGLTHAAVGRSDGIISVYDLPSGTLRHELSGHEGAVSALCFDPKGERLISGSTDHTIRLWDFVLGTPYGKKAPLKGHEQRVGFLGFAPDGARLLSASDDRTFKIWDFEGERELFSFARGSGPLTCLQFTRDQRRLLTVSRNDAARIFQLAPNNSKDFEIAGALTFDEKFRRWHQTLSEQRYDRISKRALDSKYMVLNLLNTQSEDLVGKVFSTMQDTVQDIDPSSTWEELQKRFPVFTSPAEEE